MVPVTLPPGRARLAINPTRSAPAPFAITIGTVRDTRCKACADITGEPIATSGTDRNFYDRYFFNGYTMDGHVFFAVALGVYPHLNVMDASFTVIADGVQHNLRASKLLKMERMDTTVGPITVEVVEPLNKLRVKVGKNEHGIEADLLFQARDLRA